VPNVDLVKLGSAMEDRQNDKKNNSKTALRNRFKHSAVI